LNERRVAYFAFAEVYIAIFMVRLPEFQGEHTLPVIQRLPGQ